MSAATLPQPPLPPPQQQPPPPPPPSSTSRRLSRSNSTSSSVITAWNTSSRQGHRASFQMNRPTSSDSTSPSSEKLSPQIENNPLGTLRQARKGLNRVSHSTRASLSGIESSFLRSINSSRETKQDTSARRPTIPQSQYAVTSPTTNPKTATMPTTTTPPRKSPQRSQNVRHTSPLPATRKVFGSQDMTPVTSLRTSNPEASREPVRSNPRDPSSSVNLVDHQRSVNKLGQNVETIALQYTTGNVRTRIPRESKLGNGVYQAANSSHISLQKRPSHSRQRRERSTNSSRDTTTGGAGGSMSSIQSEQSRGRGHRSAAQKEMLSQALGKANIAVELDNAQNVTGAIQAYVEACDILDLVMRQSKDQEDRRKLTAIRTTYSDRIAELYDLDQSFEHLKNKDLPKSPRIPAHTLAADNDDDDVVDDGGEEAYESEASQHSPPESHEPKPLLELPPRQESLLPLIFGGAEYIGQPPPPLRNIPRSKENLNVPMDARYAPPPLSPRRPLSPQQDDDEKTPVDSTHSTNTSHPLISQDHAKSTSWLNTVDENASSTSSSRLSSLGYDNQDAQLVSAIQAEFDAMNAAVDAAYQDDPPSDTDTQLLSYSESLPTNSAIHSFVSQSQLQTLSTDTSFNTTGTDMRLDPLTGHYLDADAQNEEALLDKIMHGGDATEELSSGLVSALPRQSDSSGISARSSGRTWDSSLTSNTTTTNATAHSTLGTLAESPEAEGVLESTNLLPADEHASKSHNPSAFDVLNAKQASLLPQLPVQEKHVGLRDRRLSTQSATQLKIETFVRTPINNLQQQQNQLRPSQLQSLDVPPSQPLPDLPKSATITNASSMTLPLTPLASVTSADSTNESPATPALTQILSFERSELSGADDGFKKPLSRQNTLNDALRAKNLSLATKNLHELPATPGSAMLPPKSSAGTSSAISPQIPNVVPGGAMGGMYLFDHISQPSPTRGPHSPTFSMDPAPLEPCPESFLLRPFWLMRTLYQTLAHPKGGWLSNKLFVPRDIWRTRSVKLKALDDKIAQLNILTEALLKLAKVDTLDADAVLEELQSFEVIIDQARITLQKKLGGDVGSSGLSSSFRFSPGADETENQKGSKSFASSWRKLRSKSSATALTGSSFGRNASDLTMATVPMKSSSGIPSSRSQRFQRYPPPTPTTAPYLPVQHSAYMSSLALLFDAVQVLDSIARQVEDPGLKATNKTQVGLEISMRNVVEFFAFFIIRFALADVGMLIDKYLKRGGEWVMT